MRRAAIAALVAGCRAGVATPPDLTPVYDLAAPILDAGPDMSCLLGPEICDDGCDNDGNGYTDGDDPACSAIAIAVVNPGGAALRWRFGVSLSPFQVESGGSQWSGDVAYRADVAPGEAFVNADAPARLVERRVLLDGTVTWRRNDLQVRDVCFFGGAPILVEPGAGSGALHVLDRDGGDERVVPVAAGAPAACASDGKLLYVPIHSGNARSVFLVFDGNFNVVAMRPMPPALAEDRCLDLAWTSRGFWGLFTVSGGAFDSLLDATHAWPFGMDGGVGMPVDLPDGSTAHSLGEFFP